MVWIQSLVYYDIILSYLWTNDRNKWPHDEMTNYMF